MSANITMLHFIILKNILCEIFTVSNSYARFLCTKNMTCNHEWYIYKILWANYNDKNDKHQFDLFFEQRRGERDVKSDDKKFGYYFRSTKFSFDNFIIQCVYIPWKRGLYMNFQDLWGCEIVQYKSFLYCKNSHLKISNKIWT